MSIADVTENNILKLIYQAVVWANIAQNNTTSPDANTAVALHTADPGDAGTQATTEANYTSYARASVARTTGGWTITANSCSPAAAISFPAGTGGSGTVTHFSTGKLGAAGSAADIFLSGIVTPNIVTGNGVTPQLTTNTTITLD